MPKQVTKQLAEKASASLRNCSQNGATLVGLTQVKSTSVVKCEGSFFDVEKGANRLRAEPYFAPEVLQIKDSSRGNLRREPTKEEHLFVRNNSARETRPGRLRA